SIDDPWVGQCRQRLVTVAPRAYPRPPRFGYERLAPAAEKRADVLSTYGGKPASADSGPGFFGSVFADEDEKRLREFAKGLGAAKSDDWKEAYERFAEAAKGGPPEAGYH